MNMSYEASHVKDGIIDFTAGSFGGIALVYVGQPLDTVKVKMQTFPSLYSNMMNCFVKTFRNDGIAKGLYAGTVPALATNIIENSVLFLCYGFCQKAVQRVTGADHINNLSMLSNASAGFLAAFFSSIAICPAELLKCKLQAMHEVKKQQLLLGNKMDYVGPLKLTKNILQTDGVTGLFRGLVPTLVREMPGYFFFFGGYEGTRELLRKPGQTKDDLGLLKTMLAGGVGGTCFWIFIYPVDVAKSRIQVNNLSDSLITTIMNITRLEGVTALFNGLKPTLLRTIPSTATLFVTYEYTKRFMNYMLRDI